MTTAEWFQFTVNSLNELVLTIILFLLLFTWWYIIYFFNCVQKSKVYKRTNKLNKFAILVPARNESHVISNCLSSLKRQDYNKKYFDVYVIVESEKDPTCKIVKNYGFNYIVRGNLEGRRTKGYALDDAYHYLEDHNLKYDAFMIFDADNIVNKNYITLMNDVKNQGYQVGVGYRNFTNATKNWVSACSGILFSFMNQFTSKGRSKLFKKATLTGTGYYLDSQIVKDAGGWIWNGMTEDVELTYYCYQHNISMHYYPKAQYFDEQATTFKQMHTQHVRWVAGFFASKKKFKQPKDLVYDKTHKIRRAIGLFEYNCSIYPFIAFIVVQFINALIVLGFWITSFFICVEVSFWLFWHFVLQLMWIYLSFSFIATITIAIDNHHLKLNFGTMVKIFLTYIFFFLDFFFAVCDMVIHKNKRTSWKVIEHKGEVNDKQAIDAAGETNERKVKKVIRIRR